MTSLKTTLLLLFCLSIGTITAQPHYDWNDKVQNVYESISSLRMPEARRLNAIEKKNDPDNLVFHLLDSYADLYQLFFNENNIEYNNIYPKFNRRIELLKTGFHKSIQFFVAFLCFGQIFVAAFPPFFAIV